MGKAYALWGAVGLLLGVLVGYGISWASVRSGGEYFAANNSERPDLSSTTVETVSKPVELRRPRVSVINGERHEFGTMPRGGKKSHVFLFKNIGDAPLTLEKGSTTCRCTLSELENGELAPGAIAEVTVEWEGISQTPMFNKSAEINTNDPERRIVRLSIDGTLEDSVRALPEAVHLSNLPGDQTTVRTLRLYGAEGEEPLELKRFEFTRGETAKFFQAEFRTLNEDEMRTLSRVSSAIEVTITILPGLPTGKLDQTLHVEVNSPYRPELDISITGNVISDISVVGIGVPFNTEHNLLSLGTVSRAEGTRRELAVMVKGSRRDELSLEIDRVEPPEALRATLGEPTFTERYARYPLTVEIIPGAPPLTRLGTDQGKTGKIYLKAPNSATKELMVHVTFVTN